MERTPSRKSSQATCARIKTKGGNGKILPREEEYCKIDILVFVSITKKRSYFLGDYLPVLSFHE